MSEAVDLIIHARWIIPVEPANTTLEHHALAIRHGRIVAVLPEREARERFSARREVILDRHVLMPGLVNRWFPGRLAGAMGLYSAALMSGCGLAEREAGLRIHFCESVVIGNPAERLLAAVPKLVARLGACSYRKAR